MNIIRGPHKYNVYHSDTYDIKVYVFGEHHKKEEIDIPSITLTDLINTGLSSYKISLYLELPNENALSFYKRNVPDTDMLDIYDKLVVTPSDLIIYLADSRQTEGRNLFNTAIMMLVKMYYANLSHVVLPDVVDIIRQLYFVIKSIRTDPLGNDNSFDFLIFQCDDSDQINNLLESIDDSLYIIINQAFNKRLADIGVTKQYFLETIETIIKAPDESGQLLHNLIGMFVKWHSIILDIYIIASMFHYKDKNVIMYTGSFHSQTISIVLDAIGFELLESYTNNKDYIKIDNLTF